MSEIPEGTLSNEEKSRNSLLMETRQAPHIEMAKIERREPKIANK